jgi:type I restriction enzyme S subunit
MPSQLPLIRPYRLKALSARQRDRSPEHLLRQGELLISTDGTAGRIHPVTAGITGRFGSNNLARVWDETFDMGYLDTFLVTPYGQHQLCKDIYGGVVDHINEGHIATVLVPEVDEAAQKAIGDLVREAYTKKDDAISLARFIHQPD